MTSYTVMETDPSYKTCGWVRGAVEAVTRDQALALARQQYKPRHKGTLWVQLPDSQLNKGSRVKL